MVKGLFQKVQNPSGARIGLIGTGYVTKIRRALFSNGGPWRKETGRWWYWEQRPVEQDE